MLTTKIAAVARYEFMMHWRRRGLLVVMLALIGVLVLPTLLIQRELGSQAQLGPEGMQQFTRYLVTVAWRTVGAVLFAVMPFVFADAIPRDRQLGVREILDAVPLTRPAYLVGKPVGAWVSALAALLGLAILAGLAWWVLVSPFEIGSYIEVWVIGAAPMALINIGLIVLLAGGQRNGRLAVLVCVAFVAIIPLFLGFEGRGDLLEALNPLRPGIFYEYPRAFDSAVGPTLPISVTILAGSVQLILVGVALLLWMRWRDNH